MHSFELMQHSPVTRSSESDVNEQSHTQFCMRSCSNTYWHEKSAVDQIFALPSADVVAIRLDEAMRCEWSVEPSFYLRHVRREETLESVALVSHEIDALDEMRLSDESRHRPDLTIALATEHPLRKVMFDEQHSRDLSQRPSSRHRD